MPVAAILILLSALFVAFLQFAPITATDVVVYSQDVKQETIETDVQVPSVVVSPPDTRLVVTHVPMPEAVKAIYMSSCVAGTPSFRQELVDFINETEVNSVVIDIKDASGSISFSPTGESWKEAWMIAECGARDMQMFIASLHDQDIYVIGRLSVFQDPLFTAQNPDQAVKTADGLSIWKDYKGISFVDVASQPYWDRVIELVVESYNIGFDEINFDYIRYPSDGNMQNISFPVSAAGPHGLDKQVNLEAFFAYLHTAISDEDNFSAVRHENTGKASSTPNTSADLFGMTTSNYNDLSIGQVQERAMPYFDAIAPMVYPSHYPHDFMGLGNPNNAPYQVVYYAMRSGVDRAIATTSPIAAFTHTRIGTTSPAVYKKPAYSSDVFRTWIQDFDYGGDYDAADVRAQIQASYDAGVDSWMVWAPSNRYTRGAYKDATASISTSTTPVGQ
jgi:hypothetical protein